MVVGSVSGLIGVAGPAIKTPYLNDGTTGPGHQRVVALAVTEFSICTSRSPAFWPATC